MDLIGTRQVGRRSLLVEVRDASDAASLARWARERGVRATEIVPAARSVLFDEVADLDALAQALSGWRRDSAPGPARLVEVPVHYDGPDLADVARGWGMTEAEAVATHLAGEYVVGFCGFAPGFAYLTGLPEHLAVPRLDEPRARVRAGAVGLAGTFTGIYPRPSPGGWRILGHTSLELWDPSREQPALLVPGSRVRFVESS